MRKDLSLKPHTVVCTYSRHDKHRLAVFMYYEVLGPSGRGEYNLAQIDIVTGAISEFCTSGQATLELAAPTHPVYIKWAQRRLADRLEGLDRT